VRFVFALIVLAIAVEARDFQFEYSQISGIASVDNRLVIEGDRATWYHEPGVPLIENDTIGEFRTIITAAEQDRLASLMPAKSTPGLRPDMRATSVRLRIDGRQTEVALAPGDPAGTGLVAEARKIVGRAQSHPYRALRIGLATDPLRVSIENPGSERITLPLDEQTLFIEWTEPRSSEWRRVEVNPWPKAVVVKPGHREDLVVGARLTPIRPQLVRAVYSRRSSSGPEDVSGTASSKYVQLKAGQR